jgi:hypothetical protein
MVVPQSTQYSAALHAVNPAADPLLFPSLRIVQSSSIPPQSWFFA